MAITDIPSDHPLTEKQWSRELFKEHVEELYMNPFMGTGMRAPIVTKLELEKSAGDQLSLPKSYLLDQDSGVIGAIGLEGKEQALEYGDDILTAIEIRNAVRFRLGMSDQRTMMNHRMVARDVLMEWKNQETDNKIFEQLSTTPSVNRELQVLGVQTGPDAEIPGTPGSIDEVTSDSHITVEAIRRIKLHAITGNSGAAEKIKPFKDAKFGMQMFLFFVDPFAMLELKQDPAYIEFAKESDKGRARFFEGGITEIDNVVIIECDKIVRDTNAGDIDVARNLFVGAGAAAVSWAGAELMDGSRGHIQTTMETFDYKHQVGVAIGDIKGVKKLRFTRDNGILQDDNAVIQVYSASIPN